MENESENSCRKATFVGAMKVKIDSDIRRRRLIVLGRKSRAIQKG